MNNFRESDKKLLSEFMLGKMETEMDETFKKIFKYIDGRHQCEKCDKSYKRKRNLEVHQERAHSILGKLFCSYCKKRFSCQAVLDRHLLSHSENKQNLKLNAKIELKSYECFECGKNFEKEYNMVQHRLRCHYKGNNYICDECGKCFAWKFSLRKHMMTIHKDDKSFTCYKCAKSFKNQFSLDVHFLKFHKNFNCQKCEKFFEFQSDLEEHLKIHLKNFQCKECGNKFFTESELKYHSMIHS